MDSQPTPWQISVRLRNFLTMETCPPRWKFYDLYLFQDEPVAFYAGQSYCAFERVWEHIRGGPHGHSIIGRFVLRNWPRSGQFMLTLFSSQAPQFAPVGNNLDAAEKVLIESYAPCFNVSLNAQPAALPAGYLPPNASIKYLKNYKRMLREAGYASRKSPDYLDWE